MKRSRICLPLLGLGTVLLLVLLLSGYRANLSDAGVWRHKRDLVAVLGITDLSLSSEARYTRHLSQADIFSAFQDFPAAFEHFPTGSMLPPRPSGYSGRVSMEPARRVEP